MKIDLEAQRKFIDLEIEWHARQNVFAGQQLVSFDLDNRALVEARSMAWSLAADENLPAHLRTVVTAWLSRWFGE